MNPRLARFCDAILAGHNQSEALRIAAPHLAARWKPATITHTACRYAALPVVRDYIDRELARLEDKRRVFESKTLTRARKRAFLGNVVESHVSQSKDVAHYREHDPLIAIQIDNKMTGDDAPVKVEGEVTLSVIMRALQGTTGLPPADEITRGDAFDVDLTVSTEGAPITPDPAPLPPAPAPLASLPGLPTADEITQGNGNGNGNGHHNGNGHGNGHHNGNGHSRTYPG